MFENDEKIGIEPQVVTTDEVDCVDEILGAPVVEETVAESFEDLTAINDDTEIVSEVGEVSVDELVQDLVADVEPEVCESLEDVQTEELVAEAPVNPMIICTATDPEGLLIVGGVTQDGRGYLMKKYEDGQSCPTLAIGGGVGAVKTLYVDVYEDGCYDIISCCTDAEGRINVIRCDSDLNILKSVHVNKSESYVTSFTKWKDIFLVGTVYVTEDKGIVTTIIQLDADLNVINATNVDISVPEGYDVEDANSPIVSMITQMVPAGDVLVIGGSSRKPGTSYGFLAVIDGDFNPVKALTLTMGDLKNNTVEGINVRHGVITIMCVCLVSDQPQPVSVVKQFNLDLEQVEMVEDITVSETETTITDGEDVTKVVVIKETETVIIEDVDKGYN